MSLMTQLTSRSQSPHGEKVNNGVAGPAQRFHEFPLLPFVLDLPWTLLFPMRPVAGINREISVGRALRLRQTFSNQRTVEKHLF
jgi:hypothetical protein